jgi:hypothetical protein
MKVSLFTFLTIQHFNSQLLFNIYRMQVLNERNKMHKMFQEINIIYQMNIK